MFLNPDEFATVEEIKYWANGDSKPPLELKIAVAVNSDENMNSVWNKTKNIQRIGQDQTLFQTKYVFFCAREDFDPPPKKNRKIRIAGRMYEVLGAGTQGGMLKVELRKLEE